MKALVVTIDGIMPPMLSHWHIVDSHISRHLVTAVQATYGKRCTIEQYEWEGHDRPRCRGDKGCNKLIGVPDG